MHDHRKPSNFDRLRRLALAMGLLLTLAVSCVAQVRNGDLIAADPHLVYAGPERLTEEFQQQDPEDARASSALENPASAADWNDRAVLDARLQRLAAAEEAFVQAIQLEPDASLSYLNLGRLYLLLDESEQARNNYARLAARSPSTAGQLYQQAVDFSAAGRLTEARWIMQALAGLPADSAAAPGMQATLWLAGDAMHALDYGRAREYYDRVLAVDAFDARALFGRGYIAYLAEDWSGAAELLGLARKHGSVETGLPYYLTRALFERERYDEALTIARSVPEPGLALLTLHGRIRLIQDYRADLSDLLARAQPADRDRLRQIWYGSSELRQLPELGGEFQFLY
ncbi:MAG: hypothetical protein NXI24_03170 [bacterium]|nr:hypothetical protein [bacterium]